MRRPSPRIKSLVLKRTRWSWAPSGSGTAMAAMAFAFAIVATETNGQLVPTCTPPPAGMVSWWPGDGDAKDIQDGNDGTLQGGATFANGKVGSAFSLNGTSAYVEIPDSTNLSITGQLTIDAWINPNDVGSNQTFVSKYNTACPNFNTEQRSYAMDVRAGGTIEFCVYNG